MHTVGTRLALAYTTPSGKALSTLATVVGDRYPECVLAVLTDAGHWLRIPHAAVDSCEVVG